ncbi:DUF5686 family protein [Flavobacterium litorale]|uniref:DUF5686 and carboxypeptidase regulatory-like domain-containing protein n=1 Tax=Flavobacterium litorale TaxID=2856519 RepID=A0ABX8V8Y1_9FLAO|nr:DUF5686 family protein [Flavobacterium litorale]QYJ69286.1 DUF5686 and carboxypeptidase regulatory-like domain-containing protein [Flavobacterium litorale]
MKILTLLLLLISLPIQAQFTVTGNVRESAHNNPLPFATITTDKGKTLVADIDGKFSTTATQWFTINYIGYQQQKVTVIPGKKNYSIVLQPSSEELDELVLERNNNANTLIRKILYKKPENDPRQRLGSFVYKSYNRLVVTANPDSITGRLDSIYGYENAVKVFEKIDSTDFKFKKLIEQQHIYQTEKVSEFKFNKKQGLKENVLATRMAGFKQPLYEVIGLTLQSYSVYANTIELVETNYAGPLSSNALKNYHYKILDTVAIDNRSVYVVFFTPKRKRKSRKLEGLLYVDKENYGIAKAVFRVSNVLDITSTHIFKYDEGLNLWFPSEKKLKIVKGDNKEDIKILGETITFDGSNKDNDKREKDASDYVYLLSESVNFEYEYNIPVKIKNQSVGIEIKEEAINRPEAYWNSYRIDTMDNRSMKTYIALDSIVAKEKLEKKIILGKKIINGYLPVGSVDIDLREIVKYNDYEGFRLGIGGVTNDKISEYFRLDGYGAYGTKDGVFKYSGGGSVRLDNYSSSWLGVSYTDDILEIASTSFVTDNKVFKIYDPRPINISTFYEHITWRTYVKSKLIPKSDTHFEMNHDRIYPKFNYTFLPNGSSYQRFDLVTALAAVQWSPFSDFMQTPQGRIEVNKRYPKFTFQYTQSVSDILGSDLTFGKFDFKMEAEKRYLSGQKTSGLIQTGIALGNTPLTHLYNTSPNNLNKDTILQRITFAGKNSFETMYFNEFFSSRYAMAQLKHGFSRFAIFNAVKLAPVLVTRVAWGNMENPERHEGIEYDTLEKGYYESGLELNEIFKGFGFSAFYRYGPYHLSGFDKNISVKISFMLSLF